MCKHFTHNTLALSTYIYILYMTDTSYIPCKPFIQILQGPSCGNGDRLIEGTWVNCSKSSMAGALTRTSSILDGCFNPLVFWSQWEYLLFVCRVSKVGNEKLTIG